MQGDNLDSLLFADTSLSPQSSQSSLPHFVCLQTARNIDKNTEAWHNTTNSFTSEVGLQCTHRLLNWTCMALAAQLTSE